MALKMQAAYLKMQAAYQRLYAFLDVEGLLCCELVPSWNLQKLCQEQQGYDKG